MNQKIQFTNKLLRVYQVLLAFPAGLALANLLAATLAAVLVALGLAHAEALMLGLLVAYLALPCWVLLVFCARHTLHISLCAASLGVLAWLSLTWAG